MNRVIFHAKQIHTDNRPFIKSSTSIRVVTSKTLGYHNVTFYLVNVQHGALWERFRGDMVSILARENCWRRLCVTSKARIVSDEYYEKVSWGDPNMSIHVLWENTTNTSEVWQASMAASVLNSIGNARKFSKWILDTVKPNLETNWISKSTHCINRSWTTTPYFTLIMGPHVC